MAHMVNVKCKNKYTEELPFSFNKVPLLRKFTHKNRDLIHYRRLQGSATKWTPLNKVDPPKLRQPGVRKCTPLGFWFWASMWNLAIGSPLSVTAGGIFVGRSTRCSALRVRWICFWWMITEFHTARFRYFYWPCIGVQSVFFDAAAVSLGSEILITIHAMEAVVTGW